MLCRRSRARSAKKLRSREAAATAGRQRTPPDSGASRAKRGPARSANEGRGKKREALFAAPPRGASQRISSISEATERSEAGAERQRGARQKARSAFCRS